MAVKCTECGASIQDDSKFCKYCGAKIPEEAKIDVKKRELRIETINHAKIRREELKAEKEANKEKAEAERLEQLRKLREEENKSEKRTYLFYGAILLFCLIMYLINRK